MRFFLQNFKPVFAPEDEGGAAASPPAGGAAASPPAGGAAASPPAGGAAAPPPDDGAAPPAAAAPYYPEGLAEHLRGADNQQTIDNLFKAAGQHREFVSKFGQPPKSADEYKFELSETAQQVFSLPEDDKALSLFKQIAHEHDFTSGQIAALPKFLDAMVEQDLVPKPVDMQMQFANLAPQDFSGNDEERYKAGAERLNLANTAIDNAVTAKDFSEEEAAELKLMAASPAGLKLVERFVMNTEQSELKPGGERTATQASQADYNKRVADPRNQWGAPEYDEAYAKQTLEMAKQLWPS